MFGETLAAIRKEKSMSMQKLADELNTKYRTRISKSMIHRWEKGLADPQLEYVRILADYFRVPIDDFTGLGGICMDDNKERIAVIANNIKRLLQTHNITQKKLANDLKLSQSAVTAWMKHRNAPTFGVIQELADYFGVLKTDIDSTWKNDFDREKGETKNTSTVQKIREDESSFESSATVSRSEQRLLNSFNELNDGAQSKVLSYIEDLKANRKNLKNINSEQFGEFSQELA